MSLRWCLTDLATAATALSVILLLSLQWNPTAAFSPLTHHKSRQTSSTACRSNSPITSIDVSDLGLRMEDLEKPIPSDLLGDFKVTTNGCQSTSRIESINDEGCLWEESSDAVEATLSIAGLRGQPVAAMDIAISTTTCTVSVFGFSVWSCILKGECVPESATFKIEDGFDMTPLITLSIVKKRKENAAADRWDGFLESIGEDSIL